MPSKKRVVKGWAIIWKEKYGGKIYCPNKLFAIYSKKAYARLMTNSPMETVKRVSIHLED